ncbi:MAG: macro domain-containing protein [Zavarzinella sp.]
MIKYTHGNLLDAQVEALVNTVNTVGVMGKGIALMFKERFRENFRLYKAACRKNQVQTGKIFVTTTNEISGPRWIVNFPTKQHWRSPSRLEWIVDGLQDLRQFLIEKQVKSIAIPPLGAGNGGLLWAEVRKQIELTLGDLSTEIQVFEPTTEYQNISKATGVEQLTPSRALIAELVRRYWVLGIECSLLEIQKLAWFLDRAIDEFHPGNNLLNLQFQAHKYGPYANRLDHLLNNLDGSYLHSEKRISDANPFDVIWFADERKGDVQTFLQNHAKEFVQPLDFATSIIDGFESPFGMELLATVDWLLVRENVAPTVPAVREALHKWPGGINASARKLRLFNERVLGIALERLTQMPTPEPVG